MAVVVGRVEVLSLETGLWCMDCMLSTGLRLWYVTSTGLASTLRSKAECRECGGRDLNEA